MIDLHTHSTFSDGSMTPEELIAHTVKNDIEAISLTDHDTVAGVKLAVAAGERAGIEVVPGIEFSASSNAETHILGYYIDIENNELKEALPKILRVRGQRMSETAKRLQELGLDITEQDAIDCAGGAIIGRAHFAKAMAEKGYVDSVREAFAKYLSVGRPAYVNIQLLSPPECVGLIRRCGGLAFVAHVHTTRLEGEALYDFLRGLKDQGLSGIEGYYSDYTPEMREQYMRIAKELGLAVSGGTDFHGAMKSHISIGTGLGDMDIPYRVLENIKALVPLKRQCAFTK